MAAVLAAAIYSRIFQYLLTRACTACDGSWGKQGPPGTSNNTLSRAFTAEKLHDTGLEYSTAKQDMWMSSGVKSVGENYNEYVLMYVYEILSVQVGKRNITTEIQRGFKFNNDKIEEPEIYFGDKLHTKILNGIKCWTLNSVDYVK